MATTQRIATTGSTAERVSRLLHDLQMLSEERYALVQALRTMVLELGPEVTEEVKYGGLLFSAGAPFCGIYAYTAHVSLEFGRGAAMADPSGVLEGAGKGRRHIKLRGPQDLRRCDFAAYLAQAKKLSEA